MRWFKHISMSQHDETLSELMDEFGAEGYGVWWIVLEKIAQLMDETGRCFARFSLEVWSTSAKVSPKRFQSIIGFLEKKDRFIIKHEGRYITIECQNLLKYRDEWTERKAKAEQKARDELPSNSVPDSGVAQGLLKDESDTHTHTDTETEIKNICAFDNFFEAYPRKKGRETALRAWKKHKLNAIADQIIADVKMRIEIDVNWKKEITYIPHPATYLNGKLWTDKIETQETTRANKKSLSHSAKINQQNWESDKLALSQWEGGPIVEETGNPETS